MAATVEQLPILNDVYPLDAGQLDRFASDGHICLRRVCSPDEVAAYRGPFLDTVRQRAKNLVDLAQRDTYGKAFIQIGNLWQESQVLRRFVFAERFARIAAELLGVEAVRLYHDQALYKEPHGGFTPWHQDEHYWPLDTDRTITMWMPLVDVTASMGTMNFASGSHPLGYLGDMPISDDSERAWAELVRDRGFEVVNHGAMHAGDATFHTGWTLHGAPGNDSDRMREVMTIIYFADGARAIEPDNFGRKNDLATWLPGCQPGDLAASELNPVLYRR